MNKKWHMQIDELIVLAISMTIMFVLGAIFGALYVKGII